MFRRNRLVGREPAPSAALDPKSSISAYKFAAVKVERKAAGPTAEGLNATAG